LAVVSNGAADPQRAKIEAIGFERDVHGCLISGEVGTRKPDARIFALAAEAAGASLDDA
jgi:FMN phosphatase YigB (HAD superfamily)